MLNSAKTAPSSSGEKPLNHHIGESGVVCRGGGLCICFCADILKRPLPFRILFIRWICEEFSIISPFESTRNQIGYSKRVEFYMERIQSAGEKRHSQKEGNGNEVVGRDYKRCGGRRCGKNKKNPLLSVPSGSCNPGHCSGGTAESRRGPSHSRATGRGV